MKRFFVLLWLCVRPLAAVASVSPDWVTETPLEFIVVGRFAPGSAGADLLVVDKDTGLARFGRATGSGWTWTEQPTGMDGITGLTTLRGGAVDRVAAVSPGWNAVQVVTPGDDEPRTRPAPVVGPHALLRLATGHAGGAPVEDLLVFSRFGAASGPERVAGMVADGSALFEGPMPDLPESAQFVAVGPAPGIPVLAGARRGVLRVEFVGRGGLLAGGFAVSGAAAGGWLWAEAAPWIVCVPEGGTMLEAHRLASVLVAGGFQRPSGVAATLRYALPEPVVGLDTVPFSDPARPGIRGLAAVRFASAPDVVRLYRLDETPVAAVEMGVIAAPVGANFAGLVAVGGEFVWLGGVGGRVDSWQRHAQPGAGRAPVLVGSGSLPATRPRAAHPNLFVFTNDPFLSANAVYLGSRQRPDWTTVTAAGAWAETDGGAVNGLRGLESFAARADGDVLLGNQLLPGASVAGFGPTAGRARGTVEFVPPGGTYRALRPGERFPVQLRSPFADGVVRYRIAEGEDWKVYEAAQPPGPVSGAAPGPGAVMTAYAEDRVTGEVTRLASARYTFAVLPGVGLEAVTDADGDGLGDAWERFFGITDPLEDTDGDSADAVTEYRRGTDPLDGATGAGGGGGADAAEITFAAAQDGQISLAWPVEASGFLLETSVDLATWIPVAPQPAAGTTWSAPLDGVLRFFRLRSP